MRTCRTPEAPAACSSSAAMLTRNAWRPARSAVHRSAARDPSSSVTSRHGVQASPLHFSMVTAAPGCAGATSTVSRTRLATVHRRGSEEPQPRPHRHGGLRRRRRPLGIANEVRAIGGGRARRGAVRDRAGSVGHDRADERELGIAGGLAAEPHGRAGDAETRGEHRRAAGRDRCGRGGEHERRQRRPPRARRRRRPPRRPPPARGRRSQARSTLRPDSNQGLRIIRLLTNRVNALSHRGRGRGHGRSGAPRSVVPSPHSARATAWRILLPKVDSDSPQYTAMRGRARRALGVAAP